MILDPSSLFWLKVAYISTWPPATSFLNFDSNSQFVISDTGARFLIKDRPTVDFGAEGPLFILSKKKGRGKCP